ESAGSGRLQPPENTASHDSTTECREPPQKDLIEFVLDSPRPESAYHGREPPAIAAGIHGRKGDVKSIHWSAREHRSGTRSRSARSSPARTSRRRSTASRLPGARRSTRPDGTMPAGGSVVHAHTV